MTIRKIGWWPLFIIVLIALGLRLINFGDIPHGLNRDEASIGYTAYLLQHTGMDEHGKYWPLKFESFGDWKQPGYIYIAIPFIYLFGLSSIAVRLPSLIFSLMMMVAGYLLANKIANTKRSILYGLGAAGLLSLNPWHFHFSHLALETMVAAAFFSFGILSINSRRRYFDALGFLLFIVSLLTYHAALIVVPMWVMGYLIIMRKEPKTTYYYPSLILFLIVAGIIFGQAWFSAERDKVTGTTIFAMSHEEQWQEIYQYRISPVSSLWTNKYVYWLKTIANNYLRTFSPTFLLTRGGTHPHYNVPGFGNFYPVEVGLALLGGIFIVRRRNTFGYLILLVLLLAPLPAAITRDGVHSTREIFLLPTMQVIAGYGFGNLINLIKRRRHQVTIGLVLTSLLIFQAWPFLNYYWHGYRIESDVRFSGYMKEVSLALKTYEASYKHIFVAFPFESPYILYAFYTQMPTTEFMASIEYYSVDSWGFTHVKKMGIFEFPENVRALKTVPQEELQGSMILARSREKVERPIVDSWSNLKGETEIIAYSD
jgi:hypothetical protein